MWPPPGGMRIPDRGSTTGAASWTDREPASGLPRRGERSESIPPSPPYFKKSSYESTGFFFACGTYRGGREPPTGVRQLATPVGQTASPRAGSRSVQLALPVVEPRSGGLIPPAGNIKEKSPYLRTGSHLEYAGEGGIASLRSPLRGSPRAGCPAGASEASQSPPHRHIRDESLYASAGSFLLYSPRGEPPEKSQSRS